MNRFFLFRLLLDFLAAGLLVFAFSYWWLGNTAHEVAGTALFMLIIAHNFFNRRWYGTASIEKLGARALFNLLVTLLLAVAMIVLLVTSVLISHALSGILSAYGGFTVRQIHTLAAYWVLVIISVHLGLRWPMILSIARNLSGISRTNSIRTLILRLVAFLIAIHGVWSSMALGLGTKLSMQMTLDWWNFEESVAAFFVHCLAIAGLYIALTYYAMKSLQYRQRKNKTREAAT